MPFGLVKLLTKKSELDMLLDVVDSSSSSLDELSGHLLQDPSIMKINDCEVGDKDDVSGLSSGDAGSDEG